MSKTELVWIDGKAYQRSTSYDFSDKGFHSYYQQRAVKVPYKFGFDYQFCSIPEHWTKLRAKIDAAIDNA